MERWVTSFGEPPTWLEKLKKEAIVSQIFGFINSTINRDGYKTDSDLDRMVKYYEDLLKKGSRVIIYAHSQGNMYANLAVERVIERNPDYAKSIRIIGLATPDLRVVNSGTHISAHEDMIINGIRAAYDSTLPANVSFNLNTILFGIYHSFVNHYMKHLDSLIYLEDAVMLAFDNLEYPKGNGTEISFTLNKNGNSNVYLAVSEGLWGSIGSISIVGPPVDPNLPYGSPNGTLITGNKFDTYFYPCGSLRGKSITLTPMVVNTGYVDHEVTVSHTTPGTPRSEVTKVIEPSDSFNYKKVGGFIIYYDKDTNSYHVSE